MFELVNTIPFWCFHYGVSRRSSELQYQGIYEGAGQKLDKTHDKGTRGLAS
jgi:hypothetical protein